MGLRGLAGLLAGSAFLSDVDARDRRAWRVTGSVAVGVITWLVVSLIAAVALLLIYAVAIGAAARGPQAASQAVLDFLVGDVRTWQRAIQVMLFAAISNGCGFGAGVLAAAGVVQHRFKDYVTHAPRIRWRLLVLGMGLCAVMMSPLVLAERLFDPHAPMMPILSMAPDIAGRLGYIAGALVLLTIAAAAEELFFRGWVLRQTSAFLRHPVGLMLINGLLFSAFHLDFQPDDFAIRTLMGAGFAYMTLRLGGIEFSTGAHAANNILIVLFIEPLSLKQSVSSGFSALTLVDMAILSLGAILITELVVRVPALRRWSGLRDADMSTARQQTF